MTTLSEYVVTCIVFVFLAMMEFACVLVFSRYQDHLKEKQAQEVEKAAPNPEGAEVEAKKKKITGKLGNMVAKAAFKMDTIALGLFMLMFFIYNVAYFMVNTSKTVQEKEEDAEG